MSKNNWMLKNVPISHLPYGDLTIDNVLIFYDEPQMFSLYSKSKDTYLLCYLAEEEEDNLSYPRTYVYLPMIPSDYEYVVAGKVNLRDAFLYAIDSTIWVIEQTTDPIEQEAVFLVNRVNIRNLDEDTLPLSTVFLGDRK